MLIQIRERASGILAYIIVILIAIPFAFWGIQEYFGGPSDRNVAEVNDTEITKRVFDNQLQEQRRQLRSLLGKSYDALYKDEGQLQQNVLDMLIENILLKDETKDAGYRISDTQVFERIKSIPQLQIEGKFDASRYERLLASQRRSKVEFEEQLRQDEQINQYQGSIVYSSFLPRADKARFALLKHQKRQFDYFLIDENVSDGDVSKEEIKIYYESNKEDFKNSAKVKLEYIEIIQQEIADTLEFSEDELHAKYEEDPNRYRRAELRNARHILFKLKQDADEQDIEAAFTRARGAVNKIKDGDEFSVIAKELSEDSVSADRGGSLGFLSRTDMDNPAFVEKLFTMNVGETSNPIKTRLGVQIIHLDEIKPSQLKPFPQVRNRVKNEWRSQVAEQEFVKRAERLQELSYEHEDSLSAAAEGLGVSVNMSEWISSLTSEGIASYPKVISVAFSEEVLSKGFNSELLELADGHVAVVRMLEHQEAEIQPVDEVADLIKAILIFKKSVEESFKKGESVVATLKNESGQIEPIVDENKFTLESPGALLRNDNSVPAEILTHVFKMRMPHDDKSVVDGFQLNNGTYVVIRLNRIEELDDVSSAIDTAEWISTQGKYGRREISAMLKALRETGDVKIFKENM